MFRIVKKRMLAPRVNEYVIEAEEVARHALPGQFIILRTDDEGERIPFTICDTTDKKAPLPYSYRKWDIRRQNSRKFPKADI